MNTSSDFDIFIVNFLNIEYTEWVAAIVEVFMVMLPYYSANMGKRLIEISTFKLGKFRLSGVFDVNRVHSEWLILISRPTSSNL